MTIGEKYGPAMEIRDQAKADAYFAMLVEDHMSQWGKSRVEALATVRGNLGYYAGYYSAETRERVERLFRCSHPVCGSIASGQPTAEDAFAMGVKHG